MKLEIQKMQIIEELLLIQDKNSLEQISKMIRSSISSQMKIKLPEKKETSFEEWNSKFKKSKFKRNEKIPDLGITLLEFRKKIYKSEVAGKSMSLEQFKKDLKNWKRKTTKSV